MPSQQSQLHLQSAVESQPLGSALVAANLDIIEQLIHAFAMFQDGIYLKKKDAKTSSIGMHIRHIIEFYQALLASYSEMEKTPLCYDARRRNLMLESCHEAALLELKNLQKAFKNLPHNDRHFTLSVILTPNQPMQPLATSLHRELYHLLDHTIHHMALIKMIAGEHNLALGDDFGVAKSTQDHLRKQS